MPLLIRPATASAHLPIVAAWLHRAWWAAEGYALADTIAFLREASGPSLPIALIAERDGQPVGTATLDIEDLPGREDLSPWLASVLVAPNHRRQGIATALVTAVRQRAAALGHARLWLFTADQAAFYAKRDWQPAGVAAYRGQPVALMVCELAAPAPAPPPAHPESSKP